MLLDNGELGKISRKQVGALRPVGRPASPTTTFADYARLCGAAAFSVTTPADLASRLEEALAVTDGPAPVHVKTDPAGSW